MVREIIDNFRIFFFSRLLYIVDEILYGFSTFSM